MYQLLNEAEREVKHYQAEIYLDTYIQTLFKHAIASTAAGEAGFHKRRDQTIHT